MTAQRHLNTVLGKVEEGSWRTDKPLTVAERLIEHWLPAQRSRGLRPNTDSHQSMVVQSWIRPYIGGTKVAALAPLVVSKMVEDLRSQKSAQGRDGLSPRAAQRAGTSSVTCPDSLDRGNPYGGTRPVKPEVAVQIPSGPPVRSAHHVQMRAPRQHGPAKVTCALHGRVAQSAERAPEKREVTGSTPVPTTKAVHADGSWRRRRCRAGYPPVS